MFDQCNPNFVPKPSVCPMTLLLVAASLRLVTQVHAHSLPLKQRPFLESDSPATVDLLQGPPTSPLQGFQNWPNLVMSLKSHNETIMKLKSDKAQGIKGKIGKKSNKTKQEKKDLEWGEAQEGQDMWHLKDGRLRRMKHECKECLTTTEVPTTTAGILVFFTTTTPVPTEEPVPCNNTPFETKPPPDTESTETLAPMVPTPIVPVSPVCATAASCTSCTAMPECGWCALEGRCVGGNKLGPHNIMCGSYEFSACSADHCHLKSNCFTCLQDATCGWCATTSVCVDGDMQGPLSSMDCPESTQSNRWTHAYNPLKCDAVHDFHNTTLWDKIERIMYGSQARVSDLVSGTVPPLTMAPTTPPPTTTPKPTLFPTTMIPVFPTTVTTTTTTKKKKKKVTTTTFMMTTTMPPPKKCKDKPSTVVDVDVCQNCKPEGEGGGEGGGANETEAEEEPPPPEEFLQLRVKRRRLQFRACCFLHPECCLPDCPVK